MTSAKDDNVGKVGAPRTNKFGLMDLKGRKFGKLLVLQQVRTNDKRPRWRCECECGNRITCKHEDLIHTNHPKTHCGCANKGLPTIHKNEYSIWSGMLARCENPKHVAYEHYHGKGIKVCERWHEFKFFLEDMGKRPSKGHSLDRIDPNGNYEPGNVRWATGKVQARNKANSLYLPHPKTGELVPVAEVAEYLGLSYQQLRYRLIKEDKWNPVKKNQENVK